MNFSLEVNIYERGTSNGQLRCSSGGARVLIPRALSSETKRLIAGKWELAGKELKREYKYYRLMPAGKKQLSVEVSKWKQLTEAIERLMEPAEEG